MLESSIEKYKLGDIVPGREVGMTPPDQKRVRTLWGRIPQRDTSPSSITRRGHVQHYIMESPASSDTSDINLYYAMVARRSSLYFSALLVVEGERTDTNGENKSKSE